MLKKTTGFFLVLAGFLLMSVHMANAQFHAQELPMQQKWGLYSVDSQQYNLDCDLLAVLTISIEKGWHTYAHTPGELGKPSTLLIELNGASLPVYYPEGTRKKDTFNPDVTVNVYEDRARLYVPIPKGTGIPFTLLGNLELLLCSDSACLPVQIEIPLYSGPTPPQKLQKASSLSWWPEFLKITKAMPLGEKTPTSQLAPVTTTGEIKWDFSPVYAQPSLEVSGLITAIFLGLLAGLILNAMPCVLPVISLKLSSVLATCSFESECNRRKVFRTHNILFSLGIMTWFVALAVLLAVTGQAWGEIFQQSWMIMTLTAIVFALSLSLFGLYSLPVIDLKFDQGTGNPKVQAYFTGLLATLLATPCSGPFLGGVLGWALTQPPAVIMTVFLSIGLGMTTPYLLLIVFPDLVRFLPKPGPWVQMVEKIVAFFLAGTCIYLINILPDTLVLPTLILVWLTVPAAWLWGKAGPELPAAKRWTFRLAGLLLFAGALAWTTMPEKRDFHWVNFEAADVAKQLGQTPMLIDFTADWCPTCKVLERTVLTEENLAKWQEKYDITFVRVDLTENNPEGEKLLHALGSRSIPVAAFIGLGENARRPIVLRDIFTASQLENLLKSYKK